MALVFQAFIDSMNKYLCTALEKMTETFIKKMFEILL